MDSGFDIDVPFMKMHGLGNDFVVFDARRQELDLPMPLIRALADRHRGVGYDQLAVINQNATNPHLTFYNSDGSKSAACGNATRCIAQHLMQESQTDALDIETDHGTLQTQRNADGLVSVNMGPPQLDWRDIPLAYDVDTLCLPIAGNPVATNMGNPHCTFFVDNVMAINLAEHGAAHETHALFPERTNVQIAQVMGPDHIRMRVWERGVGITLASGSSSCATAVAAARLGLTGRTVRVELDGGHLDIDWRDDGVWMTGATQHVFTGTLTRDFLNSL